MCLALLVPMPLGSLASGAVVLEDGVEEGLGVSLTMVEVEDVRLKVFARGARCVSLSSVFRSTYRFSRRNSARTLCEFPRHGGWCDGAGAALREWLFG